MNFTKLKKTITELGVHKVGQYLEDQDYYEDEELDEDEEDSESDAADKKKKLEKLAEIAKILILVHENGGSSGDGEHVERVYAHRDEKETIYIRLTGFYSSYEGTDWDDSVERVMPETITATIYSKYKN